MGIVADERLRSIFKCVQISLDQETDTGGTEKDSTSLGKWGLSYAYMGEAY